MSSDKKDFCEILLNEIEDKLDDYSFENNTTVEGIELGQMDKIKLMVNDVAKKVKHSLNIEHREKEQ